MSSEKSKKLDKLESFFDFHVFSFIKFFDHLNSDNDPENYYFEREWRVVGNVKFALSDIKTIFFPSKYSSKFRDAVPDYIGQVIFTD